MVIKVEKLSKLYGKKAVLKDINLTINGGMYGLLGPNGAGKTTLMRILTTLLPFNHGQITFDGVDISKSQQIKNQLGYLPQEFSFYPQLTVYELLDYLAILSGIDLKNQRRKRVEELISQVNLWEERRLKTRFLSGGMKRRLGIAQALINNPEILIVDEPTAGLDPEERVRFRNLLSDFAVNRTVILSTHIVGDIEFACEELAILNQGRLVYAGRVHELIERGDGLVWSIQVPKNKLSEIRDKYQIISYVTENDSLVCRLLSLEKPYLKTNSFPATPVKPSIEDVYLGLMGGLIK